MQATLTIHAEMLHLHFAPSCDLSTTLLANVEPIAKAPNFTERFTLSHGDQIVTDHKTGLMWPVYESESKMDADALDPYIAAFRLGGFSDWFNPSAEQRESIRDLSRYAPALFPPLKSRSNDWEWTCTEVARLGKNDAGVPAALWQVSGCYGYLDGGLRDSKAFARPCRFVARAGQ